MIPAPALLCVLAYDLSDDYVSDAFRRIKFKISAIEVLVNILKDEYEQGIGTDEDRAGDDCEEEEGG